MIERCSECENSEIIYNYNKGEIYCKNCGLVIEDSLPAFENYREGTSKTPALFTKGNIIKESWILTGKQKRLNKAYTTLNLLSSRLKLPDCIKKQAYQLYEKALDKNICAGRNNLSILHACVYASCIIHNLPKTAAEITENTEINTWNLLKSYKVLRKKLPVKITAYNPADLLPRFISKLNLSQKTLTKSIIIMNKIEKDRLFQGKNPKSIIAAVIYLSAKLNREKITQREISHHTGVIEVTIRKRYKEICKMLEIKV